MRHIPASDNPEPNERGAILVMALIFMIVGSLVILALARLATANMTATSGFRTIRVDNYAADAAANGAIQQVRYHGACGDFPKSGSPPLQPISGEYVFVKCANTALPLIVAQTTLGSTQLQFPSTPFNSGYAITAQPVTGTAVPANTTITSVNGTGTTATMSAAATATGTVTIGTAGQRLDVFTACVSTSPLTSCSTPEVTATVVFGDVAPGSPPTAQTGYSATVLSWVVSDANA